MGQAMIKNSLAQEEERNLKAEADKFAIMKAEHDAILKARREPSRLRTVDRKNLIQALRPYLDDVQNLGKIVHDYVGKPFISTWQVGGDYELKITLPLETDGKYNFTVDWGDGKSDQITSFDQAEASHEYKESGRYIVQLDGVVNGFGFSDLTGSELEPGPSSEQIVDISQSGCLGLSPQGYQFA